MDKQGYLYGTTGSCHAHDSCGTVFSLAPDGTETVLGELGHGHGAMPTGVIADAAGNLYGTAEFGGAYGYGTVFAPRTNR